MDHRSGINVVKKRLVRIVEMWNHNLWKHKLYDVIRRVLIKSSKRVQTAELWREPLYANDTIKEYIFIRFIKAIDIKNRREKCTAVPSI